jgi:predicted lipoprotein with Yx(FWY)xxD motif
MKKNKFKIFNFIWHLYSVITNSSFARDPAKIKDGVLVSTSNNMTLYVFDKDLEGSGKSECNDQCAKNWPPFSLIEKRKITWTWKI